MQTDSLTTASRLPVAVRALTANPSLRRLELASLLWNCGEQLYLVGLLVYAFLAAGTGGVAVVGIIQSAPSVVLVPIILRATDRVMRDRLLQAAVAVRVVAIGLAAVAAGSGAPPALVFGLAAVDAIASSVVRPTRSSLLPQVARSPQELIGANVSISAGRSFASLVGPALAALFLAARDVESTLVVAAVLFAVASALTLGVRGSTPIRFVAERAARGFRGGLAELARLPTPRLIVLVIVAQQLVRGMLPVLLVSLAVEAFRAGNESVGILNSAIGLGGLIGGALSIVFVRRVRVATALGISIALWGIGIVGPGFAGNVAMASLALAVGGVGKGVLEVAAITLLQRTVPVWHRAAVFGVLETVVTIAVALGAVLGAVLVSLVGAPAALVIAGALTTVLALVSWPVLRTADEATTVPEGEIRLLRGVPMLHPLTLCTIEELAGSVRRVRVPAGAEVIRQHDPGDAFYIIEAGELDTLIDDRRVRSLEPGDSFGEIALIRDIPRTATVRATTPATLLAVDREHFLAAIGGRREAAAVAEEVIRGRLGA